MHVEWDEVVSLLPPIEYARRGTDVALQCAPGERTYLRLDLESTRILARDFVLVDARVAESAALEAIAERLREVE